MKKIFTLLFVAVFASMLALTGCGTTPEAKTYNFVVTNATVPPMMATLDLLEDDNPTYMWYGRRNTFTDNTKLGFELSTNISSQSDIGVPPASVLEDYSNRILQLYMDNQDNKFNLYVTDYCVNVALKLFIANNIPEANWNVHLLEDGTGAYTKFATLYGGEDGSIKFAEDTARLEGIISTIKNGGEYDYTIKADTADYNIAYVFSAKYSNVDYYLQYPEYVTSNDSSMSANITKINFIKKSLTGMFKALSTEGQATLKSAIFNTDYIDPIIKQDNGKKTILVLGTSLNGENLGGLKFEDFFNKIVEDYGNEYNIVIKPHPSWALDDPSTEANEKGAGWNGLTAEYEARVQFCNDNNIKVLPGQTPAEALIWAYADDIKLGGYVSTTYLNAEKDMTLFFIMNGNTLPSTQPIPSLLEDGKLCDSVRVYYANEGVVESAEHVFTTVEA